MHRWIAAGALVVGMVADAPAADWPQWRGPNRDGVSKETGLRKEWPAEGPKLRWQAPKLGGGYSTPAVAAGRVFVQTTRGEEEFATALDEKDGKPVWSVPIGTVGKNQGPQYPGTRSTPTVDGQWVYCLASNGELVCLARGDGKLKWKKDLRTDFGGKPGSWVYSESVLIDRDALICTPGGETATLAALDKFSGEPIWKAPVPGGDNAEYASSVIVNGPSGKEYVQFLRKGLVGVDAKTGRFLWRYAKTADQAANIMTPVVAGARIFSSSRNGGALIELKKSGDEIEPAELYLERPLGASIGGAVLVDGYLYGTAQAMFCVELATGKIKWNERALGAASICFADGRLYVRGHESGDVALVESSTEGFHEKGRFKQPERSKSAAWPHPVVANGSLYLRDQDVLLCYDVKAEGVAAVKSTNDSAISGGE